MGLYAAFAEAARKYGLQNTVESWQEDLPAVTLEGFRLQYVADWQKVKEGGPPIITAAGVDDWYVGPCGNDRHWPALRDQFQSEGWPSERVESVDAASSTVVAHTPRSDRGTWQAKGLVVGYVQSGKTTNFVAVSAKLADVDYKMIIVLSGIHNGLRRQTQARLNHYLSELNPALWVAMTDTDHDFGRPTQDASALLSSNKTVLAVVKKNAAVLSKLIRWLDTPNSRSAMAGAPVLVIDDEADQASVATGRINPLVRRLLSLMPKSTYVGYTATPFANVFVDPKGDDLYPETFILNLPRPEGYFGPESIFGRNAVEGERFDEDAGPPDGYDMVRYVPDDDVPLLRPGSRESADEFQPEMTIELLDAIHWFWLATAARRARGDLGHSSMLIHTSVKIAVHESYRRPLLGVRDRALRDLEHGRLSALERWRSLWNHESERVNAREFGRSPTSFEELLEHLSGVVRETSVILDNYRSQDRLDYSRPSVVAIAIGGNTLSRGLTLEGLVVSFFVRAATAYDTLLQMGRWFGYRSGFEDLPRIWMTPSLADAFRHLATVEAEMRDDIDRYQRENLTPRDVAVRIRTHPSLRITAKMGAAQPAYVLYAGRRLQTRYFKHRDAEWLENNRYAADGLIQSAQMHGSLPEVSRDAILIRDVPSSVVIDFLARYEVHEDSPDLDTRLMIKYIERQALDDPPRLTHWSVAVISGSGGPVSVGGLNVHGVVRSRLAHGVADRADIKTLMSKEDRVLDIGLSAAEARSLSEDVLVLRRNQDPVNRDRGLLVLYPIDRVSAPAGTRTRPSSVSQRSPLDALGTVFGIGIVFPGDRDAKRVAATHVAVDLSDVEVLDLSEALDQDTEDS